MHLVCPHCHTTNRVATEHLHQSLDCGRCHQPLFNGKPANVSAQGLVAHIQHSELPVLVDFWAPWCGPCHAMAPEFEKACAQLEPHVRLLKVDTDAQAAAATQHGIRSIPTLILFHNGREVARSAGARQASALVQWVRQYVPLELTP